MAHFWFNQNETCIEIPSTSEINNITYYNIVVTVNDIKWNLQRRYREFFELHNHLVIDHGISKDILPSKKVIRNKCLVFIETRRKGLEEYLQKALNFLRRTMPRVFVLFLNFHLYDIYFLVQEMSVKFFSESDKILSAEKPYDFTPLELHAISECLKKPYSVNDCTESQLDLSPVLELCSQLLKSTVSGSSEQYLQSDIVLNKLPFEFSCFKIQKKLYMKNVALDMIYSLGTLRSHLIVLRVSQSDVNSISQVLQCDKLHKNDLEGSEKWLALETLDLSNCKLTKIDESVRLAEKLKSLILNDNKISTISNLQHLPNLYYLSLSNNLLTSCDELHTKVGNILNLNLSQNQIRTTKGFSKLYALETLDLGSNKITDIEEVRYLKSLPCLENLVLTGNTLATTVDYRIKVLEIFGERAKYICLDNERSTQAELDKVSILRALRIVKEGKTPDLNNFSK